MAGEEHTAEEAQSTGEAQPEAVEMMSGMPPMLAYTLRAPIQAQTGTALIRVGQGPTAQVLTPSQPKDQSYWIVILDANKPASIVQQWVVQDNKTVPSDLDKYMSNPAYLFAVVTQVLANGQVPQGPFYDYLTAHGAGRELQKLEQISSYTAPPYGLFARVSYALTGQCGSGGIAYERSSFTEPGVLEMSLRMSSRSESPVAGQESNPRGLGSTAPSASSARPYLDGIAWQPAVVESLTAATTRSTLFRIVRR